MKLEFSGQISKNTQKSNIIKFRQVGAELFRAANGRTDRQTDMTKVTEVFRNFANAPKNVAIRSSTQSKILHAMLFRNILGRTVSSFLCGTGV
jgi:hypothetical protein